MLGARFGGGLLRPIIALCGMLALAACVDKPQPSNAERIEFIVAVEEAIAQRDYARAYQLHVNLKWPNFEPPTEALIAELQGTLEYHAFGFERLREEPPPPGKDFFEWPDWYRRDLMMQVSFEERFWVACMMWKQWSELRSFKVLSDAAAQFRTTGQPFPRVRIGDIDCNRFDYKDAEEEAFFRGKNDDLYRIALPRTKGTGWEAASAAFTVATVLLYAPSFSFHLVPEAERRQAGLTWLRKAADAGDGDALGELASVYRWGLNGLPQDAELAHCFKFARHHWLEPATCRAMEKAHGHDDDSPPPKD